MRPIETIVIVFIQVSFCNFNFAQRSFGQFGDNFFSSKVSRDVIIRWRLFNFIIQYVLITKSPPTYIYKILLKSSGDWSKKIITLFIWLSEIWFAESLSFFIYLGNYWCLDVFDEEKLTLNCSQNLSVKSKFHFCFHFRITLFHFKGKKYNLIKLFESTYPRD